MVTESSGKYLNSQWNAIMIVAFSLFSSIQNKKWSKIVLQKLEPALLLGAISKEKQTIAVNFIFQVTQTERFNSKTLQVWKLGKH